MPGCVKNWPASERPRERLFHQGAQALSDAELIALLLRQGLPGKDVTSFARELLEQFDGLRGVLHLNETSFRKIKGMGPAKIAALMAVSEITKRVLRQQILSKNYVKDPESVMEYLYASLRDKKREVFKVLFLNKANAILNERDLFEGTIDEAVVHPREIVRAALECHATAIVLVHNHPSGRVQPSLEDREMTKRIIAACETVSINVLDHLVIGDNQYFSFCEHGLL